MEQNSCNREGGLFIELKVKIGFIAFNLESDKMNIESNDFGKNYQGGNVMKIVIACDSYKGSCSTLEAASAIEKGIKNVYGNANVVKIPVADGGEGTVDSLVIGMGGTYEAVMVKGPLGEEIEARYGILSGNIAVIEMAAASGLLLVEAGRRNPMLTTTYGTGQLIKAAMDRDCKRIYIGIGGSATNDGGAGMAKALGVSFMDKNGNELALGGGSLNTLDYIEMSGIDTRLKETEIIVMSDVTNPLCGRTGASYVYGPQKGATAEMVELLDNNLCHYGMVIEKQLGLDIMNLPGAGAAGGLGAGLMAFCSGELYSGIEKILDITNIDEHLRDADLVITGEGRIDSQSIYGKVPVGVAKRASKYDVPVVAIVGSIGDGAKAVYSHGITAIMDIVNKPMTLSEAMENAPALIEQAAETMMRIVRVTNPCH